MSLLKRLANLLPASDTLPQPSNYLWGPPRVPGWQSINEGITLYASSNDQTFIEKGFQKNYAVHTVVNKCVKKFSQVPFYHYQIKRKENKTWEEYRILTKNGLDAKAIKEARKMLTKAVEQTIVDSELSKFLSKPNRNQTGSKFRGNLYGHKLLTGEGNIWLSREKEQDGSPNLNKPPQEMFVIPKQNLALIKGPSAWDIDAYKLLLSGQEWRQDKANIIMWIFDTFGLDPITLNHLRGQAPLDAGLLTMQASNEAGERLASMNKNQGVSAIAYNKSMGQAPTPEQAMFMRKQFDSLTNDSELAGKIAALGGDWGFHQVGMDARQLGLLEQMDKAMDIVCMLLDVPIGLFKHGTTYENKPEEKRDFVYSNIAPACYELRDQFNEKLVPQFGLDRERDVVDCDIMSLPELSDDLKTQVASLKDAWWLTPNQVLDVLGYEQSTDPNMNKVYIPSGLRTLDEANLEIGGPLDNEETML